MTDKQYQLHCDECNKEVGSYLYGKGGIEERALIANTHRLVGWPDIICFDCLEYKDPTPNQATS